MANVKSYIFRVDLEEEEDGGWSASVPALPGCAVSGDTIEETLEFLREAAKAYVEVLIEDGRPIPEDRVAPSVIDGPAVAIVA
jgi:predicted RNase H-like HicB family nuclease